MVILKGNPLKGRARPDILIVLLIFFLALGLRTYFSYTANVTVEYDQATYDKMAMNILHNHEFSEVTGKPTAYTVPLYPIFLSAIYFVFGHSFLWVRIVQAVMGSILCFIVYFIAREAFGRGVALWALFLTAIHYFFIRYGLFLFSENLFMFLTALSVLFLIKFCKKPRGLYAGLFGLTASLATLTRSAYFLFPFMVLGVLFLGRRFLATPYKRLFRFALVMLICFLFPIGIWTVRNFMLFKAFIPLGTEAGVVLYAAYNPPQGKILDASVHDDITLEASKKPELEYGRFLVKHTLLAIKKDPAKIYKYIPLKLMYFFSVFDWVAFDFGGAYNFSTAFILPLSILGIIILLMKRAAGLKFIVLLPFIYFLCITVVLMGVPRMRLPVEPYLIIFAAFFVNYIYKKSRLKAAAIGMLSGWYCLNYILYLNSGAVKVLARTFFEKIGLW